MIEEEQIYRQKYLKYKKKYLTALENMTGGADPKLIQENSTIYFCLKDTYDRLQASGRDNGLIKGKIGGDSCFIERLSMPFMSLVLSKPTVGNWELKTIDGKECKFPNYPFLCGRKLGIIEGETAPATNLGLFDRTKAYLTKSGTFTPSLALKQIQEFQPFILKKLNEINNSNSGTVYYLHTYGNNVSYNGELKYLAFPTTQAYADNPKILTEEVQQGGGGAKYYICNKQAAEAIEKHYKNTSSVNGNFQAIVTDCLDDIALDKLDTNGAQSEFGMIDELATEIYIRKTDGRTGKFGRENLPNGMVFGQKTEPGEKVEKKSFDEKTALGQFDQIINALGWNKEKTSKYPISIYKLTSSLEITRYIKTLKRIEKKIN